MVNDLRTEIEELYESIAAIEQKAKRTAMRLGALCFAVGILILCSAFTMTATWARVGQAVISVFDMLLAGHNIYRAGKIQGRMSELETLHATNLKAIATIEEIRGKIDGL